MKIIIATHNKNKLKEFTAILNDYFDKIISLEDLNDYEDIEETGSTFHENALIKAKAISKKYNCISISDDSGLEVEALDNRPGVYSARYSGFGDIKNNEKILSELVNVNNRKARFICAIAIHYPSGENHVFEGIWDGEIALDAVYKNGFGYDAIFIPDGYTIRASELEVSEKNKISHRYIALRKLLSFLKK